MNSVSESLAAAIEHHRAKRFHEAEVVYREKLASNPDCAQAWQLLGMIALEAGHHEMSAEHIQRSIDLQPGQAAFHNSLGIVSSARRDETQAIECFHRAVQLARDFSEAHNNLGASLNTQGRADEAVVSFREAVRLQPNFAAACQR